MAEEPVKCEEPLIMASCERPLHHDGGHAAELPLPSGLGPFIDQAWEGMIRAKRSADRWRWLFIALTLAQASYLIGTFLRGVTT